MNYQLQTQTKVTPVPARAPMESGLLQRKCACGGTPGLDGECAECRAKRLGVQRQATDQATETPVPPIVHEVLRSPGQPLDASTRAFMAPRFGHDFSRVRVHTDSQAAESAQAVNASVYTVGRNLVFGQVNGVADEVIHLSYSGVAGAGTPSAPPGGGSTAGAATVGCNTTAKPKATMEDRSDRLDVLEKTPPCLACPNSHPDTCPKLAQRIFPPTATGPVQFSWQVIFYRYGRATDTHVIQKIENTFGFSTPPATNYAYTPKYWEAFQLNNNDQTEIDYWQFELPDLSAGTWEKKGTLYLTDHLPAGMQVGNVNDAGGLPSSTTEPRGLGRVLGTRLFAGRFDFTGSPKTHLIR